MGILKKGKVNPTKQYQTVLTRKHTTAQPGQEFPFSQDLCLECMPPPQFALHLFQGPHEDQKIGNGHGLFSLQNLNANKNGKENARRHSQCSMPLIYPNPNPNPSTRKSWKWLLRSIYTNKKTKSFSELISVWIQTQQHKKLWDT